MMRRARRLSPLGHLRLPPTTTTPLRHRRLPKYTIHLSPLSSTAAPSTTDADTALRNAYFTLGVQPGASKRDIKSRYYDMAKRTHPDAVNGANRRKEQRVNKNAPKVVTGDAVLANEPVEAEARPFVEVQAAFELLMEELEAGPRKAGAAGGSKNRAKQRPKTLGEVLIERLGDEPEASYEVWTEMRTLGAQVTGPMLDALLRACVRQGGSGLNVALSILDEASASPVLKPGARVAGVVCLLNVCTQDGCDWDVDVVVNQITDEDREFPEVLAALGSVYCAGTRSPY